MSEHQMWQARFNITVETFAEQMSNLLAERESVHFGWTGMALIANAMHLKMKALKQNKNDVVSESLDYLQALSSGSGNCILATMTKYLDRDIFPETKELDSAGVKAETGAVLDLAVVATQTLKMRMINPDCLDVGLVWFAFGVASFIKESKARGNQDDVRSAERNGFSYLAEYISSVPFEAIETVPIT